MMDDHNAKHVESMNFVLKRSQKVQEPRDKVPKIDRLGGLTSSRISTSARSDDCNGTKLEGLTEKCSC